MGRVPWATFVAACAPDAARTTPLDGSGLVDHVDARSPRIRTPDGTREIEVRRRVDNLFTELVAIEHRSDGDRERVLVGGSAMPDRAALSPDGTVVAYVSGVSGVASVWTVPFAGGAPLQRTNVGLARPRGGPPPGFVDPPLDGAPWFVGDELRWTVPGGGEAAARWR